MKFTIFTPTFNRKELLEKLYKSLQKQTYKDFEWLIVDDGSADGTKEKAEEFLSQKKLDIKYYFKENGGKQRAYNFATDKANGELFICLDSDDEYVENGLETILKYWKKYEKNKKLESDFAQTYRFVRDLFISEMTDMEFQERNVLGYDIDTLKDITHNTVKYFKTGHLFEINIDYDESVIDLNYLRALSRECELAAVEAFYKEGKVERLDMLKALNRLSSILYLMMLKANNGDYK